MFFVLCVCVVCGVCVVDVGDVDVIDVVGFALDAAVVRACVISVVDGVLNVLLLVLL